MRISGTPGFVDVRNQGALNFATGEQLVENRRVKSSSRGSTHKTTCPACGAASSRSRLCAVCGKLLSEGFQPLDAIRSSYRMQGRKLIPGETQHLFEPEQRLSADVAWACNVYSAVPYLGILFVPFALGFGGIGFMRAQTQQNNRAIDGLRPRPSL